MGETGAEGPFGGADADPRAEPWRPLPHAWRRIRWLPKREPSVVEQYAFHGRPLLLVLVVTVLMMMAAHPAVERATGLGSRQLFAIWALFSGWFLASTRILYRRAFHENAAFHALVFGNMAVGAVVCLAFPVLAGSPQNAYWAAFPVAACGAGASQGESSVLPGLLHVLAPFATLPFFVAHGAGLPSAAAAATITAAASGFGFLVLARRGHLWHVERVRQELLKTRAQLEESERERRRLSRDLHDSVGSALSLVSLYGALVEERASESDEARRLAATIRESARHALDELRGVLHALPQAPATLRELGSGLSLFGERAARAFGARLDVRMGEGAEIHVDGPVRSTLVRTFHEAMHNALRHGFAKQVCVDLSIANGQLRMQVQDDGTGTLPSEPGGGSGLSNIRDRAREIGGTADIEGRPGIGTRVDVVLPLTRAK